MGDREKMEESIFVSLIQMFVHQTETNDGSSFPHKQQRKSKTLNMKKTCFCNFKVLEKE